MSDKIGALTDLGPEAEGIIRDIIGGGDAATPEEAVRIALREKAAADAELERRQEALNAALDEGLASGPATAFDFDAFRAWKRAQQPK